MLKIFTENALFLPKISILLYLVYGRTRELYLLKSHA